MDKKFWQESWEQGSIGFHQERIHHYLQQYFVRLQVVDGETVFVPLCGKSLDMLWLQKQGVAVVGVELSPLAVQAFFAENGLTPIRQQQDSFERFSSGSLQILCGDLFALTRADLDGSCTVYDRASLVALPEVMRQRYAQKLSALLPSGSRVLLISYEYNQAEMSGPPFAVLAEELTGLFEKDFTIELLAEEDALVSHQVLAKRGLTRLTEQAHLLIRR